MPITMQGLAMAREKPPAARTIKTMEKTMRSAIGAGRRSLEHTVRRDAADAAAPMKKPADEQGGPHAHRSETRVSAIADFARESKRKKKALLLSLPTGRRDDDLRAPEKI
jgi:hypothetical protein